MSNTAAAQAQIQAWFAERIDTATRAYFNNQLNQTAVILREVISRLPNASSIPYCLLAATCIRQGDEAEGTSLLEQVMGMQQGIEWIADAGARLQQNGDMEGALGLFRFCIRKAPGGLPDEFNRIYEEGLLKTNSYPFPLKRRFRFHELAKMLMPCLDLEGEMAECGCYRGHSTFIICNYARAKNPAFDGTGMHVFDSFEGLSAPTGEDAIDPSYPNAARLQLTCKAGEFAAGYESVRSHLSGFPGITFTRGWLPQSLQGLPERRYKFVNVDVDLYAPTKGAFAYFYPRLVKGGVITSDDYNWPGARKAVDEFCAEHGLTPEITPYDQAILRKL